MGSKSNFTPIKTVNILSINWLLIRNSSHSKLKLFLESSQYAAAPNTVTMQRFCSAVSSRTF